MHIFKMKNLFFSHYVKTQFLFNFSISKLKKEKVYSHTLSINHIYTCLYQQLTKKVKTSDLLMFVLQSLIYISKLLHNMIQEGKVILIRLMSCWITFCVEIATVGVLNSLSKTEKKN